MMNQIRSEVPGTISWAFVLAIMVFFASWTAFGQVENDTADTKPCGQATEIRDSLIDEATAKQFKTRRVEIVGNTVTRYREFGRRMQAGIHEGDIFTRKALEKTVKRISKMKSIYPITMDNIEIRLDREHKDIDIIFCVKQRPSTNGK